VSLPLAGDDCFARGEVTFEVDDREHLYGSVVTDQLLCADTDCRARLWLEGAWAERNGRGRWPRGAVRHANARRLTGALRSRFG